jgi:membrane-associated phospholipid phosphatase
VPSEPGSQYALLVNSETRAGEVRSEAGSAVVARVVTEVLSPVPIVAVMDVALGWIGGHHRWTGLLYGVVAVLITIVPPYAFVLYRVLRGRYTDHHLSDRRQRLVPLLLGMAATLIGIAVLALAGAPRLLLAGLGTVGAGLLVGAVISKFWKISGHTTGAAAVLVTLAYIGHGWPLLAAPLLAVIAWARVRLGAHTVAQVIAGIAVGALLGALVMPPLAGHLSP